MNSIFLKIRQFYKAAGLTLSDDIANHIYVNTILQNIPKNSWPETYINYGIEGADKAIEYGVEVVLGRLEPTFFTLNHVKKLIAGDYTYENIKKLKDNIIAGGYDSEYRKPWLITIDRLADLAKAKQELNDAIKTKDAKSIFDKKVNLNIALNMFYDSAHSSGSILEHLSEKEDEISFNQYIDKLRKKRKELIESKADQSKIDAIGKLIINELQNQKNDEEISDKKIKKLLKLLDISRLSDSSDIIHMIKPYLDNPGKYEGHQEYTGFSTFKPNTKRIDSELELIELRAKNKVDLGTIAKEINNINFHYSKFTKHLDKTNKNNSLSLFAASVTYICNLFKGILERITKSNHDFKNQAHKLQELINDLHKTSMNLISHSFPQEKVPHIAKQIYKKIDEAVDIIKSI